MNIQPALINTYKEISKIKTDQNIFINKKIEKEGKLEEVGLKDKNVSSTEVYNYTQKKEKTEMYEEVSKIEVKPEFNKNPYGRINEII